MLELNTPEETIKFIVGHQNQKLPPFKITHDLSTIDNKFIIKDAVRGNLYDPTNREWIADDFSVITDNGIAYVTDGTSVWHYSLVRLALLLDITEISAMSKYILFSGTHGEFLIHYDALKVGKFINDEGVEFLDLPVDVQIERGDAKVMDRLIVLGISIGSHYRVLNKFQAVVFFGSATLLLTSYDDALDAEAIDRLYKSDKQLMKETLHPDLCSLTSDSLIDSYPAVAAFLQKSNVDALYLLSPESVRKHDI